MSESDLKNQQKESMKEHGDYHEFIKSAVADRSYFKDGLDWYMLNYVNPVVDRTIMVVVSVFASVALYFLVQIISSAFPLVEEVPVVIRDYDASIYRPKIYDLYERYGHENVQNVDEAVSRYLLTNYVVERESFDFRDSNVGRVNAKFSKIKNNSSFAEYKNFQIFMSRDNANSPINSFGRNIYQTVKVTGVEFLRNENTGYERFKAMFRTNIPKKANIKFSTFLHKMNSDGKMVSKRQDYLVKVDFSFAGLDRNAKKGVLNFVVNEYKLFKVK